VISRPRARNHGSRSMCADSRQQHAFSRDR
jgi:hypothetical protein